MSSCANTYDNLDLLIFDFVYGLIICKQCKYTIVPCEIVSHLRAHHRISKRLILHQIKTIYDQCFTYFTHFPAWIKKMLMLFYTLPVLFLHLHQDGFYCRLCLTTILYTYLTKSGIIVHLKKKHKWSRRSGRLSAAEELFHNLSIVIIFPITYQTFFRRNLFIRYFLI
jgi:hypothetical protein